MHGHMNVKSRHMFHEGSVESRSHLAARHTSTQPVTSQGYGLLYTAASKAHVY